MNNDLSKFNFFTIRPAADSFARKTSDANINHRVYDAKVQSFRPEETNSVDWQNIEAVPFRKPSCVVCVRCSALDGRTWAGAVLCAEICPLRSNLCFGSRFVCWNLSPKCSKSLLKKNVIWSLFGNCMFECECILIVFDASEFDYFENLRNVFRNVNIFINVKCTWMPDLKFVNIQHCIAKPEYQIVCVGGFIIL